MKHAFTLIELIIIIILIGILSLTVSPFFQRDTLIPATNQVLDHIRYTQQLALNQDMFVPYADFSAYPPGIQHTKDARQWFKKWWRIQFHGNSSYSIYSDHPTTTIGNFSFGAQADVNDLVARDPETGLFLFGNLVNGFPDSQRNVLLDLQDEYGVTVNVQGCLNNSSQILFDNLGRPHCSKGDPDLSLNPYDHMTLTGQFISVVLTDGNDIQTICITPLTGYTYITQNPVCP